MSVVADVPGATEGAGRSVIGIIPARGGSKGIVGKNLKLLGGRPLICWTIAAALASKRLSRLIVTTDDREIACVAEQWNAEVPFLRPSVLAEDETPMIDVILHALDWLREDMGDYPDSVVLLQPTCPLRTAGDIDKAVELLYEKSGDAVIGVCGAHDHPYWLKRMESDGKLLDFLTLDREYTRRQDLPPVYKVNGAIYVNRTSSLLSTRTLFPMNTYAYVMPEERSVDIDSPFDFSLAQWLVRGEAN